MAAKIALVFCVSALFVQAISGNCLGSRQAPVIKPAASACNTAAPAISVMAPAINVAAPAVVQAAARPLPAAGALLLASTSGGAFPTSSASPLAPSGLSVQSELLIDGPIAVWGEMPFASAVAFDSQLPTSGFAIADYSCGDGKIGITSESAASAYNEYAYAAPAYATPTYAAPAYAAPAYAAPAIAAPVYATPALAPAVGLARAPIASGFAPSSCGCDGRQY